MLHTSLNQNMDLGTRKSNQIKNCYKIVICTKTHAVTKMADLTLRNIVDDEIISVHSYRWRKVASSAEKIGFD